MVTPASYSVLPTALQDLSGSPTRPCLGLTTPNSLNQKVPLIRLQLFVVSVLFYF